MNVESEKHIQNEILREFGTRSDCRLWRSGVGVGKVHGRTVRFGFPGLADLHGILPGGIYWAVEVKSATGRQSPEQVAYMNCVRKFGGIYILARSVQDVWDVIGKYLK